MQLWLGVFAGLGPLYCPLDESRHGVRVALSSRGGGRHNLVAFPYVSCRLPSVRRRSKSCPMLLDDAGNSFNDTKMYRGPS